jgi:hypothetical protein
MSNFIKNHKNEFLNMKEKNRKNQIKIHKIKNLLRKYTTKQNDWLNNCINDQCSFTIKNLKSHINLSIVNCYYSTFQKTGPIKNDNKLLSECQANSIEILKYKNQKYAISKENFEIANKSPRIFSKDLHKCNIENWITFRESKIKNLEIIKNSEIVLTGKKCNCVNKSFLNLKINFNYTFELLGFCKNKKIVLQETKLIDNEISNSQSYRHINETKCLTMKKLTSKSNLAKRREGLKLFGIFGQSIYFNSIYKKSKWMNTTG